jgi:hypothetical protein
LDGYTVALRTKRFAAESHSVQQLAEAAKKDRDSLLCQLNSYAPPSQEVAG